jgi:hypothetical protein
LNQYPFFRERNGSNRSVTFSIMTENRGDLFINKSLQILIGESENTECLILPSEL